MGRRTPRAGWGRTEARCETWTGAWRHGCPVGGPHGLERLVECKELLTPDEPVWLPEGEKDTDTLVEMGLVATTNSGGAGNFRPDHAEMFRDLDVIATSADAPALIEHFTTLPWVADTVAKGDTKATVISNTGLRFDLRVVPPESYGNLLQHLTGSKDHNVAMREEAVRRSRHR